MTYIQLGFLGAVHRAATALKWIFPSNPKSDRDRDFHGLSAPGARPCTQSLPIRACDDTCVVITPVPLHREEVKAKRRPMLPPSEVQGRPLTPSQTQELRNRPGPQRSFLCYLYKALVFRAVLGSRRRQNRVEGAEISHTPPSPHAHSRRLSLPLGARAHLPTARPVLCTWRGHCPTASRPPTYCTVHWKRQLFYAQPPVLLV